MQLGERRSERHGYPVIRFNWREQAEMEKSKIEIDAQFRIALGIMGDSDRSVFITGRAGTGKSTLLDFFREATQKKVAVLAPTGVAAPNVKGQTIHSFFKFKPVSRSYGSTMAVTVMPA